MESPDIEAARILEAELPGFWRFFKDRNPEFRPYGGDNEPPLGAQSFHVVQALGPTIRAYVIQACDLLKEKSA